MTGLQTVAFKCVVLGSYGCGKTALVDRFVSQSFPEKHVPTVGADFGIRKVKSDDRLTEYNMVLWHFAGNEAFLNPNSTISKGANVFIVAFDLTSVASFEHAKNEIKKLESENIPIILVGTKSDLVEEIAVHQETINEFNEGNKYHYVETSAKENKNVDSLFIQGLITFLKREYVEEEVEEQTRLDNKSINKKAIKDDKAVNDLITLCDNYIKHLNKQLKNPDIIIKLAVMEQMRLSLLGEGESSGKLKAFFGLFTEENKEKLSKQRDTDFVRFIAGVCRVLSLVGLLIPRLGSFAFWKSHGEIFNNKVEDVTQNFKLK